MFQNAKIFLGFHDKFGVSPYDCIELKDSCNGLEIILIDENDCKLIVRFETHLAYRRIDEGMHW